MVARGGEAVSRPRFDVNAVNQMGLAAVHGAANRGSDDIIELLAQRGARLDLRRQGRTDADRWAEGVFLATNSPVAKPSTMALLKQADGSEAEETGHRLRRRGIVVRRADGGPGDEPAVSRPAPAPRRHRRPPPIRPS